MPSNLTEAESIKFANYLQDIGIIEWSEEYYECDCDLDIGVGTYKWCFPDKDDREGFSTVRELVEDVIDNLKCTWEAVHKY